MFFSQDTGNRHFKQGNNLSGQIFPFLLVCLAGLIVAVMITIRAGEGAKTETCLTNAMDAGSLAAASSWATALNKLVARNTEKSNAGYTASNYDSVTKDTYFREMQDYYNEFLGYYTTLNAAAEKYLADAQQFSTEAETLANAALNNIKAKGGYCTVWFDQKTGADNNIQAADKALEAAKCLDAFRVISAYMQKLIDHFKDNQLNNFCTARAFMSSAYGDSVRTGLSYAFSNSCITSRLTPEQGDEYSFWLGTGQFYTGTSSATYPPSNSTDTGCRTSATIDSPKIESYTLKVTKKNYPVPKALHLPDLDELLDATDDGKDDDTSGEDPFNLYTSFSLRELYRRIYTLLLENAAMGYSDPGYNQLPDGGIFQITKYAYDNCCGQHCEDDPLPVDMANCLNKVANDCSSYYAHAENIRGKQYAATDLPALGTLQQRQQAICDMFNILNGSAVGSTSGDGSAVAADTWTISALNESNADTFDQVWHASDETFIYNTIDDETCSQVFDYDDQDTKAKGLMIINIDQIELDPNGLSDAFTTKCCVNMTCNGQVTVKGCTTSKFSGSYRGLIGGSFLDDYDPEIISVSQN